MKFFEILLNKKSFRLNKKYGKGAFLGIAFLLNISKSTLMSEILRRSQKLIPAKKKGFKQFAKLYKVMIELWLILLFSLSESCTIEL